LLFEVTRGFDDAAPGADGAAGSDGIACWDLNGNGLKDPDTGVPLYDPMKGSFVRENNVRPTLRYFDGKWNRFIIGANDTLAETPVVLGVPSADHTTVGAKIYPFKKMVSDQPADSVNNRILVPHLFGLKGGPNPYWVKYDWNLALQDGAAYTEQPYSGEYQFVPTVMCLTVNHEIATKEQAYGYAGSTSCADCHTGDQTDWTELGWADDPLFPTAPPRP
jgi:hypothetical protein